MKNLLQEPKGDGSLPAHTATLRLTGVWLCFSCNQIGIVAPSKLTVQLRFKPMPLQACFRNTTLFLGLKSLMGRCLWHCAPRAVAGPPLRAGEDHKGGCSLCAVPRSGSFETVRGCRTIKQISPHRAMVAARLILKSSINRQTTHFLLNTTRMRPVRHAERTAVASSWREAHATQ